MSKGVDAAGTDAKANRLMQGFPPPVDKIVRLHDGSSWSFPKTRWSFSHQRELTPSANIRRGPGSASVLPKALRDDIDAVSFTTQDGRNLTWRQSLDENFTDGILVLHRGTVVYENYSGALEPHIPHLAMSVTKSFVGLLGAMLVHEGVIDPAQMVTHYLPEMRGTAYGDATLRQVMDMTIGVQYSETYTDPKAEIWAYTASAGVTPRPANYTGPETIFEFLQQLKKSGEHGEAFAYKTCNTEVLGWIVQRVTGTALAPFLSERIWQRLGADEDCYIAVDRIGTPMCGGGLSLTLRDLARFGEMMHRDGQANGQQIVPARVVAEISGGADRGHFAKAGYFTLPGWSYRHQWWVSHNNLGAYSARGIHGQAIWIAPRADMVIARFGSHPTAANGNGPLDIVSLPAYQALAEHLMRG